MRLPIEYNINLIKFTRLTVSAAAAAARAQAQAVNWAASLPSSATSRALRSAKQATNALHTAKYELEGRSIDRSDFEGDIVTSVLPFKITIGFDQRYLQEVLEQKYSNNR
ncbi:hypothetical protein H113_01732 [Trichophyton rubrum MR1459]|nr:hypothetical protein H100_01729 [Trichophyton rubrum MR850]EZF98477.1 hypothetical protein H113_01732 [Trichophyton rubrum MR1459]EZG09627.1 hypothetical protein H106_01500 [Trichophyton rubrum CBS 735.88]